jgi:hypothetical protein
MRRICWLGVVAVAAIVALGPGTASADSTRYPTVFTKFRVKVKNGAAKFVGRIDSPNGECVQGRKVRIHRKKSGSTDKTNLYPDPSFENGLHPLDNTAYSAESWSTAQAYSGTHSMNLGGARYPHDSSAYWFPVTVGKAYSASTYFYNPTTNPGNFRVSFTWRDASGADIGSSGGARFEVPRNVWTKVYQDGAVAPAGATQAQLRWEAIQAPGVLMDEVSVREAAGFKVVGDRTNNRGKFKIGLGSGPAQHGTYYAKVKKTRIGNSENKKTCRGRKSGSVKISG